MSPILKPDGTPAHPQADPVLEAAKHTWSDLSYLNECHNNFLQAVQSAAPKDYRYNSPAEYAAAGSPKWSVHDSFDGWCRDQEEHLAWRLHSLDEKRKQNRPSDSQLIHVVDSIDHASPFLGKEMSGEDSEIFEFMLRKSSEALHKYRTRLYTLEQILSAGD